MKEKYDKRYVSRWIPRKIPEGMILCHNHIQHKVDTPPGLNGFRAWFAPANEKWLSWGVGCPCGWSGMKHYRSRRHYGPAQVEEVKP